METIRHLLFEDPVPLLILAAAAEGIVLVLLYRHRSRAYAAAALLPLLAGLGVLLSARLVETPREALTRAVRELVVAVERKDLSAFEQAVAPEYSDGRHDRASLVQRAGLALDIADVRDLRIRELSMSIDAGRANTRLQASGSVRTRYDPRDRHWSSTWLLRWTRQDGRWLLCEAQMERPFAASGVPEGL